MKLIALHKFIEKDDDKGEKILFSDRCGLKDKICFREEHHLLSP